MRINKTNVDKLEIPGLLPSGKARQKIHYDDDLKGFGVRVTSGGSKAYLVEKRTEKRVRKNTSPQRMTIGRHGEITPEQARKKAQIILGKIAMGESIVAKRQQEDFSEVTLETAFEDYIITRKDLKPETIKGYKKNMYLLGSWNRRTLQSISGDDVYKRHKYIGENHGPTFANRTMTVLRAIFNFAESKYEDEQGCKLITNNPVISLTKTRAWYPEKRRTRSIRHYELLQWYPAVIGLKSPVVRDWLLFMLFTGLRSGESSTLKWSNVDFTGGVISIEDTKNSEPLMLPLSSFLHEILQQRYKNKKNKYVFYSNGECGHVVDPRKQIGKIAKETQLVFTPHDLRRSFATIAESIDVPPYALKMLLNHKSEERRSADVTKDYIVCNVERLRVPMQKITDYILARSIGIESGQESSATSEKATGMYFAACGQVED